MIETIRSVLDTDEHHGTEVTVRCTISGGPKVGTRGGEKTLYDVDVSGASHSGEAFLALWHENPNWTDSFGATSPHVNELVDDLPLQDGETVLARGVPNVHEDRWYFNVTSLLIRDPDTLIGKSEMRSANECPRIYNLAFEKNVYSPGRYDLSAGSVKGNIAHSVLECAIEDEHYQGNFERGWTERDVQACLSDVMESEYNIELALCRLAWVSTNRIEEHAHDAVVPLLTDDEFAGRIGDADDVSTEVALSESLGFNGRVDLLLDGVPYDLKTAYDPTDAQRRKNRFQLRIYLLALTIESLEPGETFAERLADGIDGVLVYPNLAHSDNVELERVELREQDIQSILQLRNEAAVLREGFGVPSTYDRDCAGCYFKEPTGTAADETQDGQLPPPCQFYCQSERRWECFETGEDGEVITQCPLFDQCEERLEFRNPEVTDHYNELRNALNAERRARRNMDVELRHLSDEALVKCGLLVPELSLSSVEGQRRLRFEAETLVTPSFSPGDEVRLQHADSEYFQTATYFGRVQGEYVFQLDGTPTPSLLDPSRTFEARHSIGLGTYPRQLLSQLDYAQRGEVTPLIPSSGTAGDALQEVDPDELGTVTEYATNRELYVNVPVRPDRLSIVASLVESLSAASFPEPNSSDPIPGDERRVLVLGGTPDVTETISDQLSSTSGVIRMDGFAGGDATTITPSMGAHEVYDAISDSDVIVSSTRYALSENVFHAMDTGDADARNHSEKFFDAVIIADAHVLSEPQFHFLRVLGDRLFALGDVYRSGPEMISGEAEDARLGEPYFNRLYRRFANVESPDSQSLAVPAVFTSPVSEAFSAIDVPQTSISGEITVRDATGATQSALDHTTLEYRFPCKTEESKPRFLRLRPVESVDVTQIAGALGDLRTLDAAEFTIGDVYTIQDIRFEVKTNSPAEGEEHILKVQAPVHATPFLNRLLTHNPGEASEVVQACEESLPDAVVTPFVAHANTIRNRLAQAGCDVPVFLPDQLPGEQFDDAIVSFGISDEHRAVMPPVKDIETLYMLLNVAKNVTVVGDRQTLERNSVLASLV